MGTWNVSSQHATGKLQEMTHLKAKLIFKMPLDAAS